MLTRGTAGLVGRGQFQLDLSFRHADMSAKRDGTEPTDAVVRPKVFIEEGILLPGYHEDLSGSENYLQVDLGWGLADRTTVFASMPIFTQRNYDIGHGGFETLYNIRGVGDLVLGVRQALHRGAQRSLVASVGFKVPTGSSSRIDAYDSTVLDPTLQPGTGSGDLITSILWSAVAPAHTQLTVSGSYQVNRTNDYEYRFGNEALGAVTASRAFGHFTPSLQAKLNARPRSLFHGEDVPSTGGTVLYVNAGLRLRSSDDVSFYGFFLLPAYRDVNDAQLAPRYSVLLGLTKTF